MPRPIVCGDLARRIASKALFRKVSGRMESFFEETGQLGIKVRGGTSIASNIFYNATHLAESDAVDAEMEAILVWDFSNAFGNVSRPVFIDVCRESFPELLPLVKWMYDQPSHLFVGEEERILCSTGVQQGDCFGPALFAFTLHKLVSLILTELEKEGLSLALQQWYLDDGNQGGSLAAVARAKELMSELGPQYGLFENEKKSELILLGEVAKRARARSGSEIPNEVGAVVDNVGLVDGKCVCESDDFTPFPNAMEVLSDFKCLQGIPLVDPLHTSCLGSPTGSDGHNVRFVRRKIEKVYKLLDVLSLMDHKHVALTILLHAASIQKVVHLMRATPFSMNVLKEFEAFDAAVLQCFSVIAGVPDLSSKHGLSVRQARLPARLGGLGLRSAARHYAGAFLASSSFAASYGKVVRGSQLPACFALSQSRESAIAWLEKAGMEDGSKPGGEDEEFLIESCVFQRDFSMRLDELEYHEVLGQLDDAHRRLFLSRLGPHANPWPRCYPDRAVNSEYSNQELCASLKFQLCIPFLDGDAFLPAFCDKCKTEKVDPRGHHAHSCGNSGNNTLRHNNVARFISEFARSAGLKVELEVGIPGDESEKRPGDVVVHMDFENARVQYLDVAVVSAMALKTKYRASGDALRAREQFKLKHYESQVKRGKQRKIKFHPLVMETGGCWSRRSSRIIRHLCSFYASRNEISGSMASNLFYNGISLIVQRDNAKAILARAMFSPPTAVLKNVFSLKLPHSTQQFN